MSAADTGRVRAFVAIELPEAVSDALGALAGRLRKSRVRASWVQPGNIHLTLRFCGDVAVPDAESLGRFLADRYAGREPFPLEVKGVGCFPNARRPKVVWAGVACPGDALMEAQQIAEEGARSIGLPAEKRTYHPHLTVARVKEPAAGEALGPYLERERAFDPGSFTVAGVTLFSSELTPRGAIYTRLQEILF